jgi:EAL domain-containing protein (putative c-di-GMP-specific phosphodiesterase class I)
MGGLPFDEELGFVGPDIFIPIAEQTGLIVELGEQLLRKACCDASKWAAMTTGKPLILSVNFSPVQFARIDVAALVARILKETGYSPDCLEIEITEGVLISNKEKIAEPCASFRPWACPSRLMILAQGTLRSATSRTFPWTGSRLTAHSSATSAILLKTQS